MRKRTDVSGRLLKSKHRKMSAGAFPFLRATRRSMCIPERGKGVTLRRSAEALRAKAEASREGGRGALQISTEVSSGELQD